MEKRVKLRSLPPPGGIGHRWPPLQCWPHGWSVRGPGPGPDGLGADARAVGRYPAFPVALEVAVMQAVRVLVPAVEARGLHMDRETSAMREAGRVINVPTPCHLLRRVRAAAFAVTVVSLLTTACTSVPPEDRTTASPAPTSTITAADGVALGLYYGDQSLQTTNAALGVTPAIHLTYFDWTANWAEDPVLAEDAERGQTSLVNWEPFGADFQDITTGAYDAQLIAQAQGAAALEQPVLLDFAAEMNEEEAWGGHDPQLYVDAYRHVHDIFERYAADTVDWVWAPNNTDSGGAPPAIEYYPGDDYVDWTGIDGYNWGTSDADFEWQSFADVFADTYQVLHEIGRPIIIGETASAEEGGDKAAWIAHIVPTLQTDFPDVKALVWFDVEKERDWRIRSSDDTFAAFSDLAHDAYVVSTLSRS